MDVRVGLWRRLMVGLLEQTSPRILLAGIHLGWAIPVIFLESLPSVFTRSSWTLHFLVILVIRFAPQFIPQNDLVWLDTKTSFFFFFPLAIPILPKTPLGGGFIHRVPWMLPALIPFWHFVSVTPGFRFFNPLSGRWNACRAFISSHNRF